MWPSARSTTYEEYYDEGLINVDTILIREHATGKVSTSQLDIHRVAVHRAALEKVYPFRDRRVEEFIEQSPEVASAHPGDLNKIKRRIRRRAMAAILDEEARLQSVDRTVEDIAQRIKELSQPPAVMEMIAAKLASGDLDDLVDAISSATASTIIDDILSGTRTDETHMAVALASIHYLLDWKKKKEREVLICPMCQEERETRSEGTDRPSTTT